MGRKANTIVPFLLDALDNNKYSKYLMYTDKENGIFQLVLPRMSKNIKDEDMQLLKDWHATKKDKFDYKKVKQNAVATLKRSSDEVELISHDKNIYTYRILALYLPTEPVAEFVPFEWVLGSLQSPLKYKPSIKSKRSPREVILHIKQLNTYDITHSNSKLNNVITSCNAFRKSSFAVSRNISTRRVLKMFDNLTELQAVLENYLWSHLKVQSFIIEILNQNNKANGFPIQGFLRNGQNQEKWEKNAPKLMIAPVDSFMYKEYPSQNTATCSSSQQREPETGLFEFVKQFFLVNDKIFQGILHMRKQSIESASLIEEVQKAIPLPTTSTIKDKRNLEDEPQKCFLNELLFTPGTDESKEDAINRIAELLEELKHVSSSNYDTQDRLLRCAVQGRKRQLIKEKILANDKLMFETYRKLYTKNPEDSPSSREKNAIILVKQLDEAVKKRGELVLEENNLSHFYADEESEAEMENADEESEAKMENADEETEMEIADEELEAEMENDLNFDTDKLEIEDKRVKQKIMKAFDLSLLKDLKN